MPMLRSTMRMVDHADIPARVERLRGWANQDMKRRLLARSGHRCECEECQAGIPMKLTWETCEVDHIVALFEGGTNHITNLRILHVDCHAKVTGEQRPRMAGRTWADKVE